MNTCTDCNELIMHCTCDGGGYEVKPSASEPEANSNDLLCAAVFSGENSAVLWGEINAIDNTSTMDDVHDVLYSLACALQRLEVKFDKKQGI